MQLRLMNDGWIADVLPHTVKYLAYLRKMTRYNPTRGGKPSTNKRNRQRPRKPVVVYGRHD